MQTKPKIPSLEITITNKCNMYCDSCSHFSNFKISEDIVPAEEITKWCESWAEKIEPQTVVILGGEPLLHKDLLEILNNTRRIWPNKTIMLITNGLLLNKWKNSLPENLVKNEIILVVTNHTTMDSDLYDNKMNSVFDTANSWTKQYGVQCQYLLMNYTIRENSFGNLYIDPHDVLDKNNIDMDKIYNGFDPVEYHGTYSKWGQLLHYPYENDAPDIETVDYKTAFWKVCGERNQHCLQLHDNKLFKCAPLTFLKDLDSKYELSENWKPYLEYEPLTLDATETETLEFVARTMKAEKYCGICDNAKFPALRKHNPLQYVSFNDKRGTI